MKDKFGFDIQIGDLVLYITKHANIIRLGKVVGIDDEGPGSCVNVVGRPEDVGNRTPDKGEIYFTCDKDLIKILDPEPYKDIVNFANEYYILTTAYRGFRYPYYLCFKTLSEALANADELTTDQQATCRRQFKKGINTYKAENAGTFYEIRKVTFN